MDERTHYSDFYAEWQQCRTEYSALIEAILPAMKLLSELLEDCGPCDHSVGICLCGEWAVYHKAMRAIGSIPPERRWTLPSWAKNPDQPPDTSPVRVRGMRL